MTDTEKTSPQDSETPETGIILGIDLGTTNSLIAVMGKNGPRVIRDQDGEPLIPSVVQFGEDGKITVGREARARALDLPTRTIHSVKRLIGRSGDEIQSEASHLPYPCVKSERNLPRILIDDKQYSPEEISSQILRDVKARAETALATDIRDVVITVPAYFDDAQRQATKDAAKLAGLNCRRIVNEPTAAALAYGIDGSRDGTVLVFDLGGGTFDVSILRITDGIFRVLSTAGNTHLGGDDFDRLLAERIYATLGQSSEADQETLSAYARQAIRSSAENLKIQLSSQEQATLAIDLGDHGSTELTITRSEFETLIKPFVRETIACCEQALADAGLSTETLDDIVLVGGSTRIPLVRQAIEAFSGKPAHSDIDPDQAVALGAAIQADILNGGNRDLLLLDVIPLSLGIETLGGVVSKLIMRNATVPASVTEDFSTQIDNQTGVDINIYQGEREMIADCRLIGQFKLMGIPPMSAGLPRVTVTFLVDADGVLEVTAKETRTGTEASIQVVPSFGLTRDEVNSMMQASLEHALDDMQGREDIEVRNKARAMLTGTTKAIELSDLPADETYSIRKTLKKLNKLMEADSSTQEIHDTVEKLGKLTAQIADDVISSAVTKALTEGD